MPRQGLPVCSILLIWSFCPVGATQKHGNSQRHNSANSQKGTKNQFSMQYTKNNLLLQKLHLRYIKFVFSSERSKANYSLERSEKTFSKRHLHPVSTPNRPSQKFPQSDAGPCLFSPAKFITHPIKLKQPSPQKIAIKKRNIPTYAFKLPNQPAKPAKKYDSEHISLSLFIAHKQNR